MLSYLGLQKLVFWMFNSAKSRTSHPITSKTHKNPKEVVQRCYGEIHKTNKGKYMRKSLFIK